MKIYYKRISKCVALILALLLMLIVLTDIMTCNDVQTKITIEGLTLEDENSLDAVVIGASDVYAGYAPTEAWKEYGYTSYSLASAAISYKCFKPLLTECLKRQKPKVVVLEINAYLHGTEYACEIPKLKKVIDNLPWSSNRIDAIKTIIPEEEQINFFIPLMSYHSQWKHFGDLWEQLKNRKRIHDSGRTHLKGVSTMSYSFKMKKLEYRNTVFFANTAAQYLREFLQYCKDQNIEHVLVYKAPEGSLYKNQEKLQKIWDIVHEYGYDTLDCSGDPSKLNGIDVRTDFYNRGHLNVIGMKKFTSYFGNYLSTHYQLGGNHNAQITAKWNESAEKADEVFAQAEQAIKDGIVAHYYEPAVYEKPLPSKNPAEALQISPSNFE